MRFLSLDADVVPSVDLLKGKRTAELGALVQLAKPVSR